MKNEQDLVHFNNQKSGDEMNEKEVSVKTDGEKARGSQALVISRKDCSG